MNMPEVEKCFGIFPVKYGTYMISVFGLATGGVGLAGIILYGLIEKALMIIMYGNSSEKMDDTVKKIILLSIGLTSLFLLVANVLLFLGATTNSSGSLASGVTVILMMCMFLILESIILPSACFFDETYCVIKKLSTTFVVLGGLLNVVFLEIWLYFMLVANSFYEQL